MYSLLTNCTSLHISNSNTTGKQKYLVHIIISGHLNLLYRFDQHHTVCKVHNNFPLGCVPFLNLPLHLA